MGVVDVNKKVLEKVNKNYEVKTSTTLNYFMADVNAVCIVTPSRTHFEICTKCLTANKNVFVEKPLTTNYSQAKELAQLARKQGKILMTGHIFRYNKAVQQIKKIIEKNTIGEVYYLSGHFTGLKDPRLETGALYNYAVHHIDIYNYLLNKLPEEVTCYTGSFLGRPNLEDLFIVILRYAPNIVGVIEGSWLPPGKKRDLIVVGSERSIVTDLLEQKLEVHTTYIGEDNDRLKAFNKGKKEIRFEFKEPLRLELLDFIESIKTGKKPLADAKSALNAILVVEKAMESDRLGRRVRIVENE